MKKFLAIILALMLSVCCAFAVACGGGDGSGGILSGGITNNGGNNQGSGNNQTGNNQTGNNQTGNNQTGNNQGSGNNQTGNNQGGSTINPGQPDDNNQGGGIINPGQPDDNNQGGGIINPGQPDDDDQGDNTGDNGGNQGGNTGDNTGDQPGDEPGDEQSIAGTYNFYSVTIEGETYYVGDTFMGVITFTEDFIVLVINENGTFTMDGDIQGEWPYVDDVFTMTVDNVPVYGSIDSDYITYGDSEETYVVKKVSSNVGGGDQPGDEPGGQPGDDNTGDQPGAGDEDVGTQDPMLIWAEVVASASKYDAFGEVAYEIRMDNGLLQRFDNDECAQYTVQGGYEILALYYKLNDDGSMTKKTIKMGIVPFEYDTQVIAAENVATEMLAISAGTMKGNIEFMAPGTVSYSDGIYKVDVMGTLFDVKLDVEGRIVEFSSNGETVTITYGDVDIVAPN